MNNEQRRERLKNLRRVHLFTKLMLDTIELTDIAMDTLESEYKSIKAVKFAIDDWQEKKCELYELWIRAENRIVLAINKLAERTEDDESGGRYVNR